MMMCPPWCHSNTGSHHLRWPSLWDVVRRDTSWVSFHFLELSHHPQKVKWYFPSVLSHDVAQRGSAQVIFPLLIHQDKQISVLIFFVRSMVWIYIDQLSHRKSKKPSRYRLKSSTLPPLWDTEGGINSLFGDFWLPPPPQSAHQGEWHRWFQASRYTK